MIMADSMSNFHATAVHLSCTPNRAVADTLQRAENIIPSRGEMFSY